MFGGVVFLVGPGDVGAILVAKHGGSVDGEVGKLGVVHGNKINVTIKIEWHFAVYELSEIECKILRWQNHLFWLDTGQLFASRRHRHLSALQVLRKHRLLAKLYLHVSVLFNLL